jgi:predicted Rossmann fold flavoprotein
VNTKKIIVVGGGPAGMMAAIRASQLQQEVTLLEKKSSLGTKLLLSGKGRCNLTNNTDLESFLERFSGNGQFLRSAFNKFFNLELMQFVQEGGLKLKIERQLRVFPETDRSQGIVKVLESELLRNKVKIIYKCIVKDIGVLENSVTSVLLGDATSIKTDKLILATGGISYAFTGSTGEGIKLAEKLGHNIVALRAGLVPLKTKQSFPGILAGLTLKNIALKFVSAKFKVTTEVGELLFTDFGISGPLVLTHSGKVVDWLRQGNAVFVDIDFKPGLTNEQLDNRLLREFKVNPKKTLKNILKSLLPLRFIDVFLQCSKIMADKKANQIKTDERKLMVNLLKSFRLDIAGPLPIEEAMVTKGGVSLKEINPRTMESRIVKGLYFAGEMIDIDADTGGFNLQAAFSTGYLAGESAALS